MPTSPQTLDDPAISRAVADLRTQGAAHPIPWAACDTARELTGQALTKYGPDRREVVKNPHRDDWWARDAACSLLPVLQAVLGPDIAIENTFLVIKWPGQTFEVPWHQDGINSRIELDPTRAVSAWLAFTGATLDNGCLQIAPGSHKGGYLPYELEPDRGAGRGRAGRASGVGDMDTAPVPVPAGTAVLMDVALLHRSASNVADASRVALNVRYVAPGAVRSPDDTGPSLDLISGAAWWPPHPTEGERP